MKTCECSQTEVCVYREEEGFSCFLCVLYVQPSICACVLPEYEHKAAQLAYECMIPGNDRACPVRAQRVMEHRVYRCVYFVGGREDAWADDLFEVSWGLRECVDGRVLCMGL